MKKSNAVEKAKKPTGRQLGLIWYFLEAFDGLLDEILESDRRALKRSILIMKELTRAARAKEKRAARRSKRKGGAL